MRLLSSRGLTQIASIVVMFVAVFVLAKYCKDHSPNKDDAKLKEVEAMYAQLPIYPDFQDVAREASSKDLLAAVFKYYKSNARYDDVRAFYLEKLNSMGWTLSNDRKMKDWWRDFGGRELTFRKDQYSFVIEYRGDKETNPSWNYGITVEWKR